MKHPTPIPSELQRDDTPRSMESAADRPPSPLLCGGSPHQAQSLAAQEVSAPAITKMEHLRTSREHIAQLEPGSCAGQSLEVPLVDVPAASTRTQGSQTPYAGGPLDSERVLYDEKVPSPSRLPQEPTLSELTCKICSKTLRSRSSLRQHEKKHGGPYMCLISRPHSCQVEGYTTPRGLRIHMDVIQGRRPPRERPIGECRNCKRQFSRRSNALRHMKDQICTLNRNSRPDPAHASGPAQPSATPDGVEEGAH